MQTKPRRKPIPSYVKSFAWDFSDGRCWYCGVALDPFGGTDWDHVTPLTMGGGENYWNIVPSCQSCNRSKSHYTIDQWRRRIGGDHLFWFEIDDGRVQKRRDALALFSLDDYEPYEEVPDIIHSEMRHPLSMMREGVYALKQDIQELKEMSIELSKEWHELTEATLIKSDCSVCGARGFHVKMCADCIDRRIVLGKITPMDLMHGHVDARRWRAAHRGLPTEFAKHIAQNEEDDIADRMYQEYEDRLDY